MSRSPFIASVAAIILLALTTAGVAQEQRHPLQPPMFARNIYPPEADARAELTEALAHAKTSGKRVLIIFGANWCLDCHVLDNALRSEELAPLVDKNYLMVHIDIGRGEKNTDLASKYHVALDRGVPALAVLDSRGKLLYSDQHGEFEKARAMSREDVERFLNRWKPSRTTSAK